jgi:hypothetical protein
VAGNEPPPHGGKHSAADVVAKAQAVLSEAELLQVMSQHAAAGLARLRCYRE